MSAFQVGDLLTYIAYGLNGALISIFRNGAKGVLSCPFRLFYLLVDHEGTVDELLKTGNQFLIIANLGRAILASVFALA